MKFINGTYLDHFDNLTRELPIPNVESISKRINKNYKFTIDHDTANIYVIRLHVSYIQRYSYNPEDFFNKLFLKIESMGYDNRKDHIVFTLQEEGDDYFNSIIYKLINAVRPLYDLSNMCYADEKLNVKNGATETLKHLNFIHTSSASSLQKIEHNIEKDKLFLTFNRRLKIHRIMLVGRLIEENLLDKSLVSFYPHCEGRNFKQLLMTSNYLSDHRKSDYVQWLDKEFILDKDRAGIESNMNLLTSAKIIEFHKRSYFSIITETKFDDNDISVTEKTFRAIVHKHPFVMVGPKYFLRYLRTLGYNTFHPYINESYDDIEDPVLRFEAIITELKRLANLSASELKELQGNLTPILEYNYSIHNNNYEYLDSQTTLFPYIDKFDKDLKGIVNKSQLSGGILKLRAK